MIGSAGVLALLMVTATPSESADSMKAADVQLLQAILEGSPPSPAVEPEALPPKDPSEKTPSRLPPEKTPSREPSEKTPSGLPSEKTPSPELPEEMPSREPPDPGYEDGTSPPAKPLPFLEEEPQIESELPLPECDGCGRTTCGGCTPGGYGGFYQWMRGIYFESWLAQGVTINTDSPNNHANFPVTFNDRSNDYQLNQLYLVLERPLKNCGHRWDVAGRVDLLYGTDALFTTARGLETNGDLSEKWNSHRYGLAMPQCYAEIYAPWGNGLTMKLGHFYTILGYESVPAIDNFFYSHSLAMQYGEPFTHTGFLGSKKFGALRFHAGMTRGWDNWEDNNNDLDFLGGVDWTSRDDRTSLAFSIHTGREQDEPPSNTNRRTTFSLVIQHRLADRVQYVMQYDHGFDERAAAGGGDADWFGLNQYLFYTINPSWKFGMRYEWFWDEDGTRVRPNQPGNYSAWTLGLNWTPNERLTIRPEFRWDAVDNYNYRPFADGSSHEQVLVGCDAILKF